MELIKHLLEMADDAIALNGFYVILERLGEMRRLSREVLKEGFMDNHRGDLDRKFDELEAKVIAARRALGTINSSRMTPEQQREHKSKIMRHINFFRKQLLSLQMVNLVVIILPLIRTMVQHIQLALPKRMEVMRQKFYKRLKIR